jgi:CBS domain-containing protein
VVGRPHHRPDERQREIEAMTKVGSMLRDRSANFSSSVVAHMMTPGVVQIPGDVSVSEAALLLERERMPCLLVKDGDAMFGIMTSSDIVKKVVAQGLQPHEVEVRSIMSKPVHSIEYDQMLDDAKNLMASSGSSLLIVTKQSQPVGILTARDLVLAPKRCEACIPATVRVADGEGARHAATIRQLSHVGASIESTTLLLPGTAVTLAFVLPEVGLSFTVRGTILNSSYEPDLPEEGSLIDSQPTVDIQFSHMSSSDESRIRAWVLQNLSRMSDLS